MRDLERHLSGDTGAALARRTGYLGSGVANLALAAVAGDLAFPGVIPAPKMGGRIVGPFKIARDISERRAAERQQGLLLNEVDHRVRDTLMVVLGIASRTFSPGPERHALLRRLMLLLTVDFSSRLQTASRYASGI